MREKDTIYRSSAIEPEPFVFDRRVVRVFPDMIRRSVPGYGLIVSGIALLARRYVQPGSHLYDLGCSLGAVSFAILDALPNRDNRLIAIDSSADMIESFRDRAAKRHDRAKADDAIPLQIEQADILDATIENASVLVMNFTLQFIDPGQRGEFLARLAAALRPGGVLIVSEKIRFEDAPEQQRQESWHLDFKRAQGYSDLEIARKREALEQTLRPDSFESHAQRLEQAGFQGVTRWFQCFNFASFVAFR